MLALALGVAQPAHAGTPQYPDLKTLPPRDIHFENNVDVTGSDSGQTGIHNVLRFTNTVYNVGQGDLLIRGEIDPATKTGPGFQEIFDSAGNEVEDEPAGSYKWHGGNHNHFHYENWGHYELWKASDYDAWIAGGRQDAMIIDTGSKTTSCVLDEEFVSDVPGTRPWQTYGFNGCLAQNVDGNDLLEGMSVGWGDTYDSWRDDQWIDLGPGGHLADGDYVVRSVTDPDNQIYESAGKSDPSREGSDRNDAATRFTVQGGVVVDTHAPTGSIVVNSLAPRTTNPNVTLDVVGRDDVSGVDSWRVSNDGTNWSTPFRYADDDNPSTALTEGSTFVERPWNLADAATGGDATAGTKTVFVEFHDESGKWGNPVSADIDLDSAGPASRYSSAVRSDSPVALWRLSDAIGAVTMADDLGAHDGSFSGSPTQGVDGLLGSEPDNHAVSFDGVNDGASVPASSDFDLTGDLTVEAWIKPDTLPGPGAFATVVAKPESYALQFNGSKLEFTVIGSDHSIDNGRHRLQTDVIQAGRAYHVAGTFDGTTQRLYVDGALVASQALNTPADVTNSGVSVGTWSGAEHFDGTIDEAAIYPSALSVNRLRAHYDAGNPDPQPPAAPSALAATAQSTSAIGLTWHDNATDESSYALQRSTDSSFNSGVSTLNIGQDQTSFTDSGLDPDTAYYYRLRARNPIGYSAFSSTASARTLAPAAPPPDDQQSTDPPPADTGTTTPTTPIAPVPPDPGPRPADPGPRPATATPSKSDTRPPLATLSVPRQKLARVLRGGLKQRLRSSEKGTIKLRVLVAKRSLDIRGSGRTAVATLTVKITRPGHSTTVAVKLSRFARAELKRRGKSVRFLVEATAADTSGNAARVLRAAVTVRPR